MRANSAEHCFARRQPRACNAALPCLGSSGLVDEAREAAHLLLLSVQEVRGHAPVQSQTISVRCRNFMAGDAGAQAGGLQQPLWAGALWAPYRIC